MGTALLNYTLSKLAIIAQSQDLELMELLSPPLKDVLQECFEQGIAEEELIAVYKSMLGGDSPAFRPRRKL